MDLYFNKIIAQFSLDYLDNNPLLIKLQNCLRKLAQHHELEKKFKIQRPSYIFIVLVGFAIILTAIKLFQTIVIMIFILCRGYLSVKLVIQKKNIKLETQAWILLSFLLLLFHQFFTKIDLFSPFTQIIIYNFPWYQNYKYSNEIFEAIYQVFPSLQKVEIQQEKHYQYQNLNFSKEANSFNRAFIRM